MRRLRHGTVQNLFRSFDVALFCLERPVRGVPSKPFAASGDGFVVLPLLKQLISAPEQLQRALLGRRLGGFQARRQSLVMIRQQMNYAQPSPVSRLCELYLMAASREAQWHRPPR